LSAHFERQSKGRKDMSDRYFITVGEGYLGDIKIKTVIDRYHARPEDGGTMWQQTGESYAFDTVEEARQFAKDRKIELLILEDVKEEYVDVI
jgi:hypothetical protein